VAGPLRRGYELLGRVGGRELARLGVRRIWSVGVSFGLRADLDQLPDVRPARIPIRMEPRDPASFDGFADELTRVSGGDTVEIAQRQAYCAAGVRTLYVAIDESGAPLYAQWLVRRDDQAELHQVTNGLFPQLGEGEALVEGAYTFVPARKQGAMADGMSQLLIRAREAGDRKVFTYVAAGNIPSLRGCANVGFVPDHLRRYIRRLGFRSVRRVPIDDAALASWAAAVG
jgi:hypothetical protein